MNNILEIHQGLKKKEFSAQELVRDYLAKIKSKDKEIGAFLTLTEDLAMRQAKTVDKQISEKKEIPFLAGAPMTVKDNILVEDVRCTAGSKILENYIAFYDATAIKKLKEQGAIILGKTNLDEFGMGGSTENSAFYPTKNPWNLNYAPGGSSGGSAASVSVDMCCYSLGSDTGGSIRQPAAFCGIVGLKPTYGAVSRHGLIAFASSLDQIGPITKTVEDAKIVFETISGRDKMDSTSVDSKTIIHNSKFKIQNSKIGIPREYFGKGIDKEVKEEIEKTIKKIQEKGVKIEEISLPRTKYALACYYIIAMSEASANLARYDGIRYGGIKSDSENSSFLREKQDNKTTISEVETLMNYYLKTRGEGFGQEVKRRIILGAYTLSAGYYQAYYLKAQKVRTLIREDFKKALEKVDFILTPVSPSPAFKLGEKITDPLKMYLSDIFTVSVNLAGLPALSLPIKKMNSPMLLKEKKIKAKELPIGIQIIGRHFQELEILKFGAFIEEICHHQ